MHYDFYMVSQYSHLIFLHFTCTVKYLCKVQCSAVRFSDEDVFFKVSRNRKRFCPGKIYTYASVKKGKKENLYSTKKSTQSLCRLTARWPAPADFSLRVHHHHPSIILLLLSSAVWSSRPAFGDGREKKSNLMYGWATACDT